MSAKETTLKEVGEMLSHVVAHMATKEDISNMATKEDIANMATKEDIANLTIHVLSIEQELKTIRRELENLREQVENIEGYRKEIDHAFERIAAIEKHLGIRS